MAPPFEQHSVANQFEPRGEFESGVGEHALEFFGGDVFGILDFVGVGCDIDIGLDEEDVVNYKQRN
jgi:hypothetical protein